MSYTQSHLDWPTSVDPELLSVDIDDTWLLSDDLALNNKGIYASLPLSLIQQDKHITHNDTKLQQQLLSSIAEQLSYGEIQVVPGFIKEEVDVSPPYSPQRGYESDSPGKPSKAEIASKLLSELDTFKDEPYTNWMEEKIEFPAFEEVCEPVQQPDNTHSLLLEFESVCQHPKYQLNHLTPPQSPPFQQSAHYGWTQPAPVNYATPVQITAPIPNWQPEILNLEQSPQIDVAHEMAVVDAIVQRHAQDIDGTYDSDLKSIPSPESDVYPMDYQCNTLSLQNKEEVCQNIPPIIPAASEHAYAKTTEESLFYEPGSPNSSSSCSVYGISENDDEWAPSSASEAGSTGRQRNYIRSKPYSRNVDDKRSRKKEQNKNAATRYRQKKKQEVEVLASEEKILKDKNAALNTKCLDVRRELKCLKSLMRELCKAKGLIK